MEFTTLFQNYIIPPFTAMIDIMNIGTSKMKTDYFTKPLSFLPAISRYSPY